MYKIVHVYTQLYMHCTFSGLCMYMSVIFVCDHRSGKQVGEKHGEGEQA